MNVLQVIDFLSLPQSARIDKRIPKKLFLEQGVPTAADRRLIQEIVEELHWVAALKSSNVGVQQFRDELRDYQEIAVLEVELRGPGKSSRVTQLIHRLIPYPVFLIARHQQELSLSLAHKRFSQGESGRVVLDGIPEILQFTQEKVQPIEFEFLNSLSLAKLPSSNFFSLYQGWLDRFTALEVAYLTGYYDAPAPSEAQRLRELLSDLKKLQLQISQLRSQVLKEKQLNRRVELNFEIKGLEKRLSSSVSSLTSKSPETKEQ